MGLVATPGTCDPWFPIQGKRQQSICDTPVPYLAGPKPRLLEWNRRGGSGSGRVLRLL